MFVGWVVGEQADDVGACGGQDVLDVCCRQAFVAAVAQAVGVDGFGDGGLAADADRVALLPLRCLLFGADPVLDLLERLGQQCQMPVSAVGVAGALQAGRGRRGTLYEGRGSR